MILRRSVVVAVVMMLGSTAAIGCKSNDSTATPEDAPADQAAAPAPAEQAADAPASQEDAAAAPSTDANIPAPPAAKVEVQGTAPSAHHVWMPGFWRWEAPRRTYVWVPGFWHDRLLVAPYAPPAPRFEPVRFVPHGYVWAPGFWRWTGRQYLWYGGHFAMYRPGYVWAYPHYAFVGGRWECGRVGWWHESAWREAREHEYAAWRTHVSAEVRERADHDRDRERVAARPHETTASTKTASGGTHKQGDATPHGHTAGGASHTPAPSTRTASNVSTHVPRASRTAGSHTSTPSTHTASSVSTHVPQATRTAPAARTATNTSRGSRSSGHGHRG
ncbi:MAG TPA: hypothetical protein VHB21_06425 [Minicystis sp.]|nr:hypothetical protein [Minicystis sp.]